MTENNVSYSLQDIVEIVSSLIEEIKPDQCGKFIHMLHDRLKDTNNSIARYFQPNIQTEKIRLFRMKTSFLMILKSLWLIQ